MIHTLIPSAYDKLWIIKNKLKLMIFLLIKIAWGFTSLEFNNSNNKNDSRMSTNDDFLFIVDCAKSVNPIM